MSTLSVPLPSNLVDFIDSMIVDNRFESKAGVIRYAVSRLEQEEAHERLVLAERDMKENRGLRGDLQKLVDQI